MNKEELNSPTTLCTNAAEMALQSFALMAAAEGAISAYADITGDDWKPYEASTPAAARVSRKSAAVEMAAFQTA